MTQGPTNQTQDSAPDNPEQLIAIRFGEYLLQQDLITDEQLLEALGDHWSNGGSIGSAIVSRGFLEQQVIDEQVSAYHSLDVVEV